MFFNNIKLQAVLFDMDGLLVDTEPFWEQAEMHAFRKCIGLELSVSDCKQTMGMRITECIEYWQKQKPSYFKSDSLPIIRERIMQEMETMIRTQAKPLPGVEAMLDLVQSHELPAAIVSSSDDRLIQAVVESQGWQNRFAVLQSAEHEEFGKPHPAVWISAARRLKVAPEACLSLEDSPAGVISAKAARTYCIAVPYPGMRGHPAYGIADLVLEKLSDLDPNFFIKSV